MLIAMMQDARRDIEFHQINTALEADIRQFLQIAEGGDNAKPVNEKALRVLKKQHPHGGGLKVNLRQWAPDGIQSSVDSC